MAVVASTERQADLEQQLKETGNKLAQKNTLPLDQLLPLLDRVENHLSMVDQSPPMSIINALSLSLNALVEDRYIRHSDVDVKVAVASCISEITRITAPDAPYEDELMKDVFQLIVSSFEDLSDQSSRSYAKRASILETVAKVRSCVVMLDLECEELIIKMFQHFLKAIRDYHPENVFSSMETIMTLVLDESENISLELLTPILASVKKDNEDVLPVARKLGEKVFEKTADKLKPYLAQAVKSLGYPLEDYSEIVAVICNATSDTSEQKDDNASGPLVEEVELNKAFAEEAAQAEATKLTTASSSETTLVAKEGLSEGPPEEASVVDRSSKSVMSNGVMETGNEEPPVNQKSLKKSEQNQPANESLNVIITNKVDNDDSDTGKSSKSEVKRKGRKSNVTNPKEPSDSFHADSEKEAEKLHDRQKGHGKDGQSSLGEDPSIETGAPSENENDTVTLPSSPKALEAETTKAAVSSPSQSLPDEMPSKKGGGPNKKHTSPEVDSADVPTKAPEGTSELETDAPTENENDTNTLSSPKELEVETTEAEASSPVRSLRDEMRSKKGGEPKKKQTSTNVDETSTDVPTKASEGTNELEVDAPSVNENASSSKKGGRPKKKQTTTKVDELSTDVPTEAPEGASELEVDAPSKNENDNDTLPSPKALEVETTKAAASLPSQSLPDENRSKKGGRPKKKQTSTKVDEPSTDVPTVAPEGAREFEVDAPSKNENENDNDTLPSLKALEVETTKAAASSPNQSLPDESRSKKGGRPKKKQTSTKVEELSTDIPMKAPEGSSELEVDEPSANEKDTLPSSPKTLELETTKAAASSPSESLLDQSRSKKVGRLKKKQTSTKVDEPSTVLAKKRSKGTSELKVEEQRRPGQKVPAGNMKEGKVPGVVVKSKSKDGKISGSEGKTPKQASMKVDADCEDAKPLRQTVKKGDAGDSEAKPLKQSGKKGIKSPESNPLLLTAKKGDASTSVGKAQKQSGKKGNTSISVEDKSSIKNKEEGKMRGRGQDATGKELAKSHAEEDDKVSLLKSTTKSAKEDDHFEEPNTTNSKRKRTPGKEKASETAEHGANLVGSKIKVWWPKDRVFYDGVIKSYDSAKKKHTVLYTDDEVEILNLKTERWEFLEDGSMSDEEEATEDSSPNGSTEMHKKKKAKTDAKPSPAQDGMDISPKSKLKAAASKSGRKSNKVEEKGDSKIEDSTSKSVGKSKDKSKKSSGKSVDETPIPKSGAKSKVVDVVTPKTSSKSKQDASTKTVSKSKGKATNADGSGKMKSSSLKALKESLKESDNDKESSVESEKTTEVVKEKSPETTSKVRESGTKSGKKRKKRN